MKLHFELETSEMQILLMLVSAGGMMANQAQILMQNLTEQLQAQQRVQGPPPVSRPNGEERPEAPNG